MEIYGKKRKAYETPEINICGVECQKQFFSGSTIYSNGLENIDDYQGDSMGGLDADVGQRRSWEDCLW